MLQRSPLIVIDAEPPVVHLSENVQPPQGLHNPFKLPAVKGPETGAPPAMDEVIPFEQRAKFYMVRGDGPHQGSIARLIGFEGSQLEAFLAMFGFEEVQVEELPTTEEHTDQLPDASAQPEPHKTARKAHGKS